MNKKYILNNYISESIRNKYYNKIYVYGSDNLELEKLIYKLTSSSIIGGDVNFFNIALGNYFSDNRQKIKLLEDIKNFFVLNDNFEQDVEGSLSAIMLYKSIKKTINNDLHNKRFIENVKSNFKNVIDKIKQQLLNTNLKLKKFYECELQLFVDELSENDLLIIDNRTTNFLNKKSIELISNVEYLVISAKNITYLKNFLVLKSKDLFVYSNITTKCKIYKTRTINKNLQLHFDTITTNQIHEVTIKQLTQRQFNSLRKKYLSKNIHYLGSPTICYGIFTNEKLIGAFGLENGYKNIAPRDIEQPCIYLLSDFVVSKKIPKLSKLLLYCILSKEVKILAERLFNKEVKNVYTNVFTKNKTSIKYRNLFVLHTRQQLNDGRYNLGYYSKTGRWTLKEGLELWKQKL